MAIFNLYDLGQAPSSDQSLLAKLLNNHPRLNQKLHAKNSSIITTLARPGGLFPQAQADNYAGSYRLLSGQDTSSLQQEQEIPIQNNGVIVKPNPDSIQDLLDKQIRFYETKPGDTLSGIAQAYGISAQTIKWANKLDSDAIKPGWQLVILPTDGVLHKASSNDTLPDIAKKYSADIATIISFNLLENEEDIDAGRLIVVPGGKLATPAQPKPKAAAGSPASGNAFSARQMDSGTGHIFPWGYCTYYVASKVHVPWGGNANSWLANAKAYGAVISKEPAVGSIVVTTDNARYGHVALVEEIREDSFLISEMNYKGKGIISTRWIPLNSKIIRGFIYH